MKILTANFGFAPNILLKTDNQDGVASVLEEDEINQIERDKDPEEALDEDQDNADAELEEDDELDEEAAVDRAAERNQI